MCWRSSEATTPSSRCHDISKRFRFTKKEARITLKRCITDLLQGSQIGGRRQTRSTLRAAPDFAPIKNCPEGHLDQLIARFST
jgi:hypothetical protein